MKPEEIDKRKSKQLPAFLQQERVLDARQSAELRGVSIATWRRMDRAGKLPPAVQVSTRRKGWRVRDLLEHLANRGEEAAGPEC